MMCNYSIVIPTYNAGEKWTQCLQAIKTQSYQPQEVIVVDSSSNDGTVQHARQFGCNVIQINPNEFGHGRTRQWALQFVRSAGYVLFLTQDAILADTHSVKNLLSLFDDNDIAAVFGRQLPHSSANAISAHARYFNYPLESRVKSYNDKSELGIKTAFISNSFAAYRISALLEVGGFPSNTIVSEETYVSAKMLLSGWKVAYCAEATVYHSHNYSITEEFSRYFDIGVFHSKEPWIREKFGTAEGEGVRYLKSEISYLFKKQPNLVPSALLRTLIKWLGYRVGINEKVLPCNICRQLSAQKNYWQCGAAKRTDFEQ